MTLQVALTPKAEAAIRQGAAIAGIDVVTFASRTLEEAAQRVLLESMVSVLHDEVKSAGYTEAELDELAVRATRDVRRQA